jgi:AAA ATPase domain
MVWRSVGEYGSIRFAPHQASVMQPADLHGSIEAGEQPVTLAGRLSRLLITQLGRCDADETPLPATMPAVILFADIAGSTSMTEQIAAVAPDGAEQLGRILSDYFTKLIEVISGYGGDVIRINGDAIIALWPHEADPRKARLSAARAAIALRDQPVIGPLDAPSHAMRHRLTLADGLVHTAVLSSGTGRSFLLMTGEPLKAIAVISHAGEPGDIIIDGALAEALSQNADLQPLDDGSSRLTAVHGAAAIGAGNAARFEPASRHMVSRFVPRIVIDRSQFGHEAWLAEFRTLSAVYVRLSRPDVSDRATPDTLQAALQVIAAAATELGVEIFDLIANDKGVVAEIVCGLPPFSQENNAACALEIALRITAGLGTLKLPCSVGIATGRAFCGDVGNDLRREYVITGPVMNRGARLMEAAGDGILCEDATARAAADHFSFTDPELMRLRGIDEPLAVYRLTERNRAVRALPATSGGLHGRHDELDLLTRQIDELQTGHSALLTIEGEPGSGKSRVIAELAQAASLRDCAVIVARTHPVEQATAYYPFRRILPSLLSGSNTGTEDVLRVRLLDALSGTALLERAALLEDVLPLGFADRGLASQITGAARIAGIEEIFVAVVSRVTSGKPLVLLIDDVHWIDELSSHLLLTLARRVPRLLIVAASRSTDYVATPHLTRILTTAQRRIALPRLGHASIAGMVQELLGVRSIPPRLADFVERQSEGLPLHAEQLVLSLREKRLIEVDEGRCRILAEDLGAASVPANLHSLIVSRIDTLPETEHLAAKVASAIGRIFDLDALQTVYPFPADVPHLLPALERLVNAGILRSQALAASGPTFSFRHILIQEATYELLSYEQRRGLHRQIAELLERRHLADLQPYFAQLAEHWERADVTDKTIDYRLRAAEQALSRYANDDVLMQAAKVESAAVQWRMNLPEPVQAELARLRGEALHALSRFTEAERQLSRCSALNGILVPSSRLEQVLRVTHEVVRQALWRFRAAQRPIDSLDRQRYQLVAHLHTRLAEHAYFMSDGLAVVHRTLAGLNMAERAGAVSETIEGLGALAIGLGTAGQHRLASFYRDRSVALAYEAGGLQDQALSRLFASVYSFQAGDWRAATRHGIAGGEIYHRLGDAFRYQSCCVMRAFTDIMEGHYAEGEALLSEFGAEAELVENLPVRAWMLSGLSILDMMLGRAPQQTLTRIAAADDHGLHRAERLLCDGLAAAAHFQEGDAHRARAAADAALDNLLQSAATLGAAATSVCAMAAVHVGLALRDAGNGRPADQTWQRARLACRATRSYARRTRFCQPGALRITGYLAAAMGHRARAVALWQRALRMAEARTMPLEQAACHLALARTSVRNRQHHERKGTELLATLGANPWRITPTTDKARSETEWFLAF